MNDAGSADASLFAETVISFIIGVLDLDDSRTTHAVLDEAARRAQS
jgi:hypothetical protein